MDTTPSVLAIISFASECICFRVDSNYTLLKFKDGIYDKWSSLRHLEYEWSYSFDGNRTLLDSDTSVQSLACFCFFKKIGKVDVDISLVQSVSYGSSNISGGVSSSGLTVAVCGSSDVSSVASTSLGLSIVSSSHEVRKSLTWGLAIKGIGQRFASKKEFLDALLRYSIENGFKYTKIKNDKTRFTACCSLKYSDGCKWFIRASAIQGIESFFVVKKFVSEHTCGKLVKDNYNPKMTRELVMQSIIGHVRDKPSLKPKEIIDEMRRDYGVPVNYYYARAGKKLAVEKVFGDEAHSYSLLTSYMNTMKESDPGGHFILEVHQETRKFNRLFASFEACIRGFQYCRPLLFLDSCHLKTKYKGCLMAATGKNADDGFYPLAYAVVSSENDDNWEWFLEQLKLVVSLQRPLTFITDRHVSLLKFVQQVFPNSSHGYCLWHLRNNLRNCIKGKNRNRGFIDNLFMAVAYAYTPREFSMKLNDLLNGSKDNKDEVVEFLSTIPYEHWANAFFPGQRYGDMCSSIAESFNSWVGEQRFLPITSMLDYIRMKLTDQFSERRKCSNEWSSFICPKIQHELKERIDARKIWPRPIKSSSTLFEVHSIRTNVVDLGLRTCTCRRWIVEGLPCAHALHCIISDCRNVEDFVDPMFLVFAYRQSYAHHIPPMDVTLNDIVVLEYDVIIPPDFTKQPGRPKTKRIPSTGAYKKGRFRSKICMDSVEWSNLVNRFDS